jgi:hypothetical protein
MMPATMSSGRSGRAGGPLVATGVPAVELTTGAADAAVAWVRGAGRRVTRLRVSGSRAAAARVTVRGRGDGVTVTGRAALVAATAGSTVSVALMSGWIEQM